MKIKNKTSVTGSDTVVNESEVEFFGPRILVLAVCFLSLLWIFQSGEKIESLINVHGSGSVFLTAPHGISHLRNQKLKKADANTTAIAIKLARKRPELFTAFVWKQKTAKLTAKRNGWELQDPNYMPLDKVEHSPFYVHLSRQMNKHKKVPLVIDIHGMKDVHDEIECDVALGFGAWYSVDATRGNLFRNCLAFNLKRDYQGEFKVDCYDKFSGNKNREMITLSRTAVVLLGIPAFQIELSKKIRASMMTDEKVLVALVSAIEQCKSKT
uniref:Uncharacterized protein n=2 Tax=Aplanochytrium stocchinoi TaxID=215587 RepID=A0A7S3PNS9_9STRA|mmetsp:Transcript_1428/g.2198  ORF Transcript_1428/g.2198 Transcript_1428/m.2198 type:complete len:269 (+) Transcript_1428:144-950(+)